VTLTGKRSLVTGANRGIGASIANALAAEGAGVAITYEKAADRGGEVVGAIKGRRGSRPRISPKPWRFLRAPRRNTSPARR
jgi:NAD(P)-dependent dehydrogenase (short-subunit alcohol dehydrogenase family)